MIDRIAYFITDNTNPYQNLAVEEVLLDMVEPGQCILYLWQNRQTVVIGKNQNASAECRTDLLREEGGFLARRMSGGGAVFHDLGNLNFTFLVSKEDYDKEKQCRVILEAVQSFGLMAEQTGRNDLLVNGRKFSGHSYYEKADRCFHNGTIMVDVEVDMLTRYLNVPLEKIQSKGVKSVRSRVINLSSVSKNITIDSMRTRLIAAFEWVYGLEAKHLTRNDLPAAKIAETTEKFASDEWIFGRQFAFSATMHRRFEWGDLTLLPAVEEGVITTCRVYSDALDADFIKEMEEALAGVPFTKDAMCLALQSIEPAGDLQALMIRDAAALVGDSF